MNLRERLDGLAPDLAATLSRFPFAVLLIALATIAFLGDINQFVPRPDQLVMRFAMGFGTAAVFAVAGRLFAESFPSARVAALLLRVIVPLAVIALWQVRTTQWAFAPLLAPASLLFLSVAPVLRPGAPDERAGIEDRFWWINQRAAITGAVAAAALALIALGLFAIERSLDLLFGLETRDLIYRWVLPIAIFLLAPVYWLSTIPRLADFDAADLEAPDFLSRAIGFLGQFVLSPLLVIYALILIAYGAQIVLTRQFPVGIIGWLALTFLVTGAANWLVLHPRFMRTRPLVALFRRFWFWLTVVPIVLFAIGVGIRVSAYGLTSERLLLIAGGLWAGLLTLAFVTRRYADIRLVPALAALLLLGLALGPWNFEQWPRLDQAGRLSAALDEAGAGTAVTDWSGDRAGRARAAIDYLARTDDGKATLIAMATARGVALAAEDGAAVAEAFGIPASAASPAMGGRLVRIAGPIDLSLTPVLIGRVSFAAYPAQAGATLDFKLQDGDLVINGGGGPEQVVALGGWLAGQRNDALSDPKLPFMRDGRRYMLIVEEVALSGTGADRRVDYMDATVFAAPAP